MVIDKDTPQGEILRRDKELFDYLSAMQKTDKDLISNESLTNNLGIIQGLSSLKTGDDGKRLSMDFGRLNFSLQKVREGYSCQVSRIVEDELIEIKSIDKITKLQIDDDVMTAVKGEDVGIEVDCRRDKRQVLVTDGTISYELEF